MINSRKRGATSILVIIMMVVLLVLGLAILTTSLSGVRLAQKKQEWLQSYYKLEDDGAFAHAALVQAITPLIDQSQATPIDQKALDNIKKTFTQGTLEFKSQNSQLWIVSLQIDNDSTKPTKHLTLGFTLDIEKPSKDALTLTSYRQWQDAFEFVALPGFEDPLTETPEFDLEEAGD